MTHRRAPGIRGPDRPLRAGRASGHGLHLHRGADLASGRALSAVLRHARRRAPALGRPSAASREVRRPSNKCNGMTYDADLNLIVCEHATSSLDPRAAGRPARGARLAFRGPGAEQSRTTSACAPTARSISPIPGTAGCRSMASSGRASSAFRASIACRPAAGAPQLLVDRYLFDQPNGLCFSPDEKLLYVNDTVQTLIRVFDVAADGSLSNGRDLRHRHPLFARSPACPTA